MIYRKGFWQTGKRRRDSEFLEGADCRAAGGKGYRTAPAEDICFAAPF